MTTIYIYTLTDPLSLQVRYVGKTNNPRKRYSAHLNSAKKRRTYTQKWISKLIGSGHKPEMHIIDYADDTNWAEKEKYWITKFREDGARLTNITDGGDGMHGYSPTAETREKLRRAVKGMKLSDEARANQSKGRLGMKFTDEHKDHLRKRKQELYNSDRGKELSNQYSKAYGVLTDEQVIEVWRLARNNTFSQSVIAKMYGIPSSTVSEIKHNKRYKHVKRPTE